MVNFPTDTKTKIDNIREQIGRYITVYEEIGNTACPICGEDPVTHESVDPFCPVCSGVYWIPLVSGISLLATVRWTVMNQMGWVPLGTIIEGDCVATIEYNTANMETIKKATRVEVDNKVLSIKDYVLRGKPTTNRIRLVMVETNETN
jgi:hypothetical protein